MFKHISEYMPTDLLLAISQQQLLFQARLDDHAALLASLTGEPDSISTLATLPQAEADLCALHSMNANIQRNIQTVGAHV